MTDPRVVPTGATSWVEVSTAALQENFAYTAWLTPIQIITPRFVKLGATFDF